jgi:PAS domain S-box-containing protein
VPHDSPNVLAARFAQLARQIGNGVIFTDPDGNTDWVNEGFVRMSGFTLEQLRGRHPGEVLQGPDTDQATVDVMRTAIRDRSSFSVDVLNYAADRRPYWVHIDCFPMRDDDGTLQGFMAIQTDITERRHTEQALQESAARFRNLFENAHDAILIADNSGRYVDANPAACILLGYTRDELRQMSPMDLSTPEQMAATAVKWNQFVAVGVQRGQLELQRRDGETRTVEYNAVSDFHPGLHLSILRDVTDRLAAELHGRRSDRLEALGTLAGGIAHDFNNILTGMLGHLEVMRCEVPEGSTLSSTIDAVAAGGARARDLVRRILAYSRQHESQRTPMFLGPAVGEAMRLLRALLPAMVTLEFEEERDTPPILGDSTALHQIVMNLCTNAWQAMPPTGGRIRVEVTKVAVPLDEPELVALGRDALVRLTVQDDGLGMSPEVSARIFEPFFTTKPSGHGTGLGLAGVQAILAAHEGTMRVRSVPGEGTTFTLWFPALPRDTPVTPPHPSAESAVAGAGQRVVLVDDDQLTRQALERMLQHLKFSVESYADPREALARVVASPNTVDVLVTDLAMPAMTGDRLVRACRATRADLPALVVTGFIDDMLREEMLGLHVTVLDKPPSLARLAATLAELLSSGSEA